MRRRRGERIGLFVDQHARRGLRPAHLIEGQALVAQTLALLVHLDNARARPVVDDQRDHHDKRHQPDHRNGDHCSRRLLPLYRAKMTQMTLAGIGQYHRRLNCLIHRCPF